MSKIASEINAEMMKTVSSTQSLNDRMVQEIESLRQQLAAAQAACKVKDEALEKLSFNAQTTGGVAGRDEGLCEAIGLAEKALAIQPDDSALKAWLGEPVAHMYQHDEPGRVTFVAMPDRMSERRWHEIPLYAPKGMSK